MAVPWTLGLRRNLVAALIIALILGGLGRALAVATQPGGAVHDAIPGVHLSLCHSGAGRVPDDPARPVPHACCDDCALLAPAVLPAPPTPAGPAPVRHATGHAGSSTPAPIMARPRDPRLSRGPPAA